MTTANCTRCNATANGGTFEEASLLLNHAVGLSRGIPCGDNYNCVVEVVDIVQESTTQDETPKSAEASYQHVEGKSGKHIKFDEVKQSAKKKLKFK